MNAQTEKRLREAEAAGVPVSRVVEDGVISLLNDADPPQEGREEAK